MTKHLIDTDIEIAVCPRCQAILFKAHHAGYAIAADTSPLEGLPAVAEALGDQRDVHEVVSRSGKPWRLRTLTPAHTWAPNMTVVADHRCGTRPMDASTVEVLPADPQRAPVTPGRPSAGLHRPGARENAPQGQPALSLPPARPATRRPSEPRRCTQAPGCTAEARIYPSGWACEDHRPGAANAMGQLLSERSWDAAMAVARGGVADRPIETVHLPESDDAH